MIFKLKKALKLAAFGLIAASSITLQVAAFGSLNDLDDELRHKLRIEHLQNRRRADASNLNEDQERQPQQQKRQLGPWPGNGSTILHQAAWWKDMQKVEQILTDPRATRIINVQCNDGRTALHLAAMRDNENICRMLILAGADKTVRDRFGRMALTYLDDENAEDRLNDLKPNVDNQANTSASQNFFYDKEQPQQPQWTDEEFFARVDQNNTILHIAAQDNGQDIARIFEDTRCDAEFLNIDQFNGDDSFEIFPNSKKPKLKLWKKLLIGATVAAGVGIISYFVKTAFFDKSKQEKKEA